MDNEQYLLLLLGQNAKDISMVADKSIQFGLDSDFDGREPKRRDQLTEHLNTLVAVVELLNEELDLDFDPSAKAIERKKISVAQLREKSQALGLVRTVPE